MHLSDVLTVAGAVGAAALITGVIAIGKNLRGLGPLLDAQNEPTAAFVLSLVLVLVAFVDQATFTAEAGFAAFLAWYGIATIAMGIHDQVSARLPSPNGAP